ncbi:MAG: hypothetical protein PHE17_17955 [Thiothrix sp.]|uniref:hypothetical protein n=1 Tax=Thiothrix sp. TaxID=1032 RepID=UPI002604C839|nr:hypothetical protein [Thiothrix sp.]MDD5394905.1 hypothetical protein [Thiothrix sp.]
MKVRAERLKPEQVTSDGDLLQIRGNQKLVPIVFLVGFQVGEIHRIAGEELLGIYRPTEKVKS